MAPGRSPTSGLIVGLLLTLAAVGVYSRYITSQLSGLRVLQSDLIDRNRRDSLHLLRIQNSLSALGLAMRDMLDEEQPYPLAAWRSQFRRIRDDLDDALAREASVTPAGPTSDGRERLAESLAQFWDAVDRTFDEAEAGREAEAREQVRLSLQARQASLTSAVARLLFENNEQEEAATARVHAIYDQVERQVYWLLTGTLVVIAGTGLYLIRINRRLFAELAALSDGRRELAQQLIATRESTLQHVSRELHDELGQMLTALGTTLGRAMRKTPEDSPLGIELREIGAMAQHTLDNIRSLSQTLHPSILDELGLESTIDWYLSTARKQLDLDIAYERSGPSVHVDSVVGIQVYRVLQEALSNAARHSGVRRVEVRLRFAPARLELEVEDHGSGVRPQPARRGLGLVAMRERAELVGGTLEIVRPEAGGTCVRLRVPLEAADAGVEQRPAEQHA